MIQTPQSHYIGIREIEENESIEEQESDVDPFESYQSSKDEGKIVTEQNYQSGSVPRTVKNRSFR